MTYTPFQEDPSIQSFQEQTGFSPIENDFGGDEVLRSLQETEQRRDLFNESRRAQEQLQRTNRTVNDQNFKIEQLEPLKQLSDFSKTVGDYFIKKDQEFVKREIAKEEINVASGIYDSVFDPEKAKTQPTLTPEQNAQNQELEARGEANFEAQTQAAQAGNFDAVQLIKSKRPDVQLGLVKALLQRASLSYGAEAEAELLERFPEGTSSLTREQQLAQIRNEKLAPITQLLSPAVIADSKILETIAKEDSKILTRAITNDKKVYGNNQAEYLEGALARTDITPEQFIQEYSVLPDATGRSARGLGTAYQALENFYSKTPLNGDRIQALKGSKVMQERPGMFDRILIAQDRLGDEVRRRDDDNQFRAAQEELGKIEEEIRKGNAYPSSDEIDKLRAKYSSNPVVFARLQSQFNRLDSLTREEQAKEATAEQKQQSKDELERALNLGILSQDMIDNSALTLGERQIYQQALSRQGNVSGNRNAANATRAEVRDQFKTGILKAWGDTESGGIVNGIMTDIAMSKYAEIRANLIQGGMDPADPNLNIQAKAELKKWIVENGGGLKGQQENPEGLFTKNPETGQWRVLEQGQSERNRALKIGQATREYIDTQTGDDWYKQRAAVSQMPGGYTQYSPTQGTLLSLSEVRQITQDVQNGKPITIPPSVSYAARVKGISPLTLINGQIEAFKEIDSTLEPIDSTIGSELEKVKAIDPQRWAELTRWQSPLRSARGLGGSATRNVSQGTGGSIDFKPENIPMVDGQNVSQTIEQAAVSNGETPALLAGLLETENGFKSTGCSDAGACGIAQFMPETAAQYGLDVNNVNQSIQTAGRYLRDIRSYLKTTDDRLVYTAYNWGMGNVGKLIDKLGEQGASRYLQDLADGKIQPRPGMFVPREAYEYFHKVNVFSTKYGNSAALRSSATLRPTFSQLAA